jgi:hypothetical protein
MMNRLTWWIGFAILSLLFAESALAQFNSHNTRGDYGILAATQPPPGFYVAPIYVNYRADKFNDADGNAVLPDVRDTVDVDALVVAGIWVSDIKVLGANYSFQIYPAWTNNNLEIPLFGVDQDTSTGFADLYIQPINLGWHLPRSDFSAGLGIYAPTGDYEFLGDDNVGLGMWTLELFGGSTIYFDDEKRWHFSTMAFYETHGEKKGTDIQVGDFLTLEGGLGWSFLEGAANVGIAYGAQWKLTDDDLGGFSIQDALNQLGLDVPVGKNRVFAVGPEVTLPIVTGGKLIAQVTLRYQWEFGARTSLEGNEFMLAVTFPIPSVSLQ